MGLILCLALCPLGFLFVSLFSELNNKTVYCICFSTCFATLYSPLPAIVVLPQSLSYGIAFVVHNDSGAANTEGQEYKAFAPLVWQPLRIVALRILSVI